MNYNSVEEILASGTTNMTVIRNNVKQDDGADTINGVSWFTYNGSAVNTIYVSGNSYIGFGSNTEHLKINRRDGAMWYLYREEGTLLSNYKFLKIRWVGYTYYNNTTSSYSLSYDVILWDTGDISLHMVSIPTTYYDGTFVLGSLNYTKPTGSTPDITFKKEESGYTVINSIIELQPPVYYLIRSNSTYYTISDGSLLGIGNIDITADNFLNYGVNEIKDISLLTNLSNPELLAWTSSDSFSINQGLVINMEPQFPQVAYYDSITLSSMYAIEAAKAYGDNVLFAITFDNGATWIYFNGSNWVNASSTSEGMTAEMVYSIPEDKWAEVSLSKTFKFRCSLLSMESTAGKISYDACYNG